MQPPAPDTGATTTGVRAVRTDIQGLRAVAVTLVLVYHLAPGSLTGGFTGVDVFFVISGFLITLHLLERLPRHPRDLAAFWSRRVRRLQWLTTGVAAASIALAVGVAGMQNKTSGPSPTPTIAGPTARPNGQPTDGATQTPQIKFAAEIIQAAKRHPRYILGAPGWTVQGVEGLTADAGEVSYGSGERLLAISWLPASEFHAHEISRSDKGTRAQPIKVDGQDGSLYDMGAADNPERQFFVLLPPEGGAFIEIRTTANWDRDAFLDVMGTVRSASVEEWLSSLPADVVSPDQVDSKVDDVLKGVPLPPDFDKSQFDNLGANDTYQFGAKVIGQVVSEWVDYWMAAKQSGRDDEVQEAQEALGTARNWSALAEMQTKGGYPDVVWEITDAVAAGENLPPEVRDYHAALGTK